MAALPSATPGRQPNSSHGGLGRVRDHVRIGGSRAYGQLQLHLPLFARTAHGLALSLGAILCLARHSESLLPRLAVLAGVQLGLVFLTRAELSFPAWAACGVGLAMNLSYDPRAHAKRRAILAEVLIPALAVPLAALVLLAGHMPWKDALRGILGSWLWVFDAKVNAMNFYRESIGLDHA